MSAEGGFPVASCQSCGREVLTHLALDGAGRELRRCVHCDADLDPDSVRWVSPADLDPLGYGIREESPGGGCARPDCGRGRCG